MEWRLASELKERKWIPDAVRCICSYALLVWFTCCEIWALTFTQCWKKKKKGFTLVSLIDHKTRFYLWILDTRKFKNKSRKDGHFHFWETIHVTSSSCNATRRKLISRPRVSLEGFRPTFTIFFSSLHLPLFLFILISLVFFLLCLIRSSRLHFTISRSPLPWIAYL